MPESAGELAPDEPVDAQRELPPRVRRALSKYRPRNDSLVDAWSFVHLGTCALLALAFGPVIAFLIALAWEPLEVLVLSPWLARFGVEFGHEHLRNSLSDVAFNTIGVLVAIALMRALALPPLATLL